jgi:hypothetical protein
MLWAERERLKQLGEFEKAKEVGSYMPKPKQGGGVTNMNNPDGVAHQKRYWGSFRPKNLKAYLEETELSDTHRNKFLKQESEAQEYRDYVVIGGGHNNSITTGGNNNSISYLGGNNNTSIIREGTHQHLPGSTTSTTGGFHGGHHGRSAEWLNGGLSSSLLDAGSSIINGGPAGHSVSFMNAGNSIMNAGNSIAGGNSIQGHIPTPGMLNSSINNFNSSSLYMEGNAGPEVGIEEFRKKLPGFLREFHRKCMCF